MANVHRISDLNQSQSNNNRPNLIDNNQSQASLSNIPILSNFYLMNRKFWKNNIKYLFLKQSETKQTRKIQEKKTSVIF